MERHRFESWRRWLARITLVWVFLFGAYTLSELLVTFRSHSTEVGSPPAEPLDTRRLLDQVMAFTMMPIAAFAIYHFTILMLARRVSKGDE